MAGKRGKRPPNKKRSKKPSFSDSFGTPNAQESSGVRDLLERGGAKLKPTDDLAKRYQKLISGINKFSRGKGKLTVDERKALAEERRRYLSAQSQQPGLEMPRVLTEFREKEISLARAKKLRNRPVKDMWTEAEKHLGPKNTRVFFLPNDPNGAHKRFDSDENFLLFVRRPYYRQALKEELRHGKFVVGYKGEGNDIRRNARGEPIDFVVLGEGTEDGRTRRQKK